MLSVISRLTNFLNIVALRITIYWGSSRRGHYGTDEGEANDGELHLKACDIEFFKVRNA